ncbi:hypothetical protein MLD38_020142 [Melastoma candidum]|uniref:Uncharacterized protein n=1 Tax=Melastoma candidum TaxID=119954 RepID=A0ACB9QFS6_9MYRT|nr:hypothetical protein MLD38_020142 [Melastoma candidum]
MQSCRKVELQSAGAAIVKCKAVLLWGHGATDVEITGGGVIDGQGLRFVKRKNLLGSCLGYECGPRLVGFVGCKNVRVWDVELRLRLPAYWCLNTVRRQNPRIHGVSI